MINYCKISYNNKHLFVYFTYRAKKTPLITFEQLNMFKLLQKIFWISPYVRIQFMDDVSNQCAKP